MLPSETGSAAGAAGVQNVTNNSSGPASGRARYAVLRDLQRWSSNRRQREVCLRQAAGEFVSVGRRDGHAVVAGAAVCGCRSCPVCGPQIQAGRRDELSQAIASARGLGWQLRFGTFTIRHRLTDRLEDTLDTVLRCFSALTSGRRYAELREHFGIRGLVRVVECKHGCEHGWHPHVHVIWFFDPAQASEAPDAPLFEQLRARWNEVTRAAGYGSSNAGQDWRDVTEREIDALAGYFTKEGADPLAWELTATDTKTRGESLTPAELLRYAAAGDPACRTLFREFEEATKGRRLIAWTPGLLRELRQSAPAADEQLAEPMQPAECLVRIPRAAFDGHVDPVQLVGDLIAIVDAGVDGESLFWWLLDRGVDVERVREHVPFVPRFDPGPPGAPWLAQLEPAL
jgi:hypothetical protein